MKFIFLFIIIVESYLSSFKIIIKKDLINSVSSFMDLNDVLLKNSVKITKYNNKSICFNYKTYSIFDDYKYYNLFLIKNKNTYLTKYSFKIFNDEYKYLFFIKAFYKSHNRTLWNLHVKYNNLFIPNKTLNDQIILYYLNSCLFKKNNIPHPILINFFK